MNLDFNLNSIWGLVSEDTDKPSLQGKDRKYDLPEAFWYQLAGLPVEEHLHVCTYETGDKTPVTEEEISAFHTEEYEMVEEEEAEIDQLILSNSWSDGEEAEYQASLDTMDEQELTI